MSSFTDEVVSSILRSTGALASVEGDLCHYTNVVQCENTLYALTIDVPSDAQAGSKLVNNSIPIPVLPGQDVVFVSSIIINDPSSKIEDKVEHLLKYNFYLLQNLTINATGVTGTLADNVVPFSFLTTLVVHGKLTGTIPNRYLNLQYLDLYGNQIKTFDGASFRALQSVNLSHNTVDSLTNFWGGKDMIKAYTHVDVSDNLLATLPSEVNTPQLEFLNVSRNRIVGTLPKGLFTSTLTTVDASHNQLSGDLPDVSGATALSHFNLSNNGYSTGTEKVLSRSTLSVFDVSNNALSGSIGSIASDVLTTFDVHQNSFTGAVPESLAAQTFLRYLDLSDNAELGGTLVLNGTALPTAETVNVSHTAIQVNITDEYLRTSAVRQLSAVGATVVFTGAAEGAALPGTLPDSLQTLDLTDAGLTGTLPVEWGTNGRHLQSVKLTGNNITGCVPRGWTDVAALREAYEELNTTGTFELCPLDDGGGGDGGGREVKKGLSDGAIAGIAVGAVAALVLLVLLVVLIVYCCKGRKKKKVKRNGERTNTGLQRAENPFRGGTIISTASGNNRLHKDTPEREAELQQYVRAIKRFNKHVLNGDDIPESLKDWLGEITPHLRYYPNYRPSELFLTPVRYITDAPANAKSVEGADGEEAPRKTAYLVLPDLDCTEAEHLKVRTREVLAAEKEINQANLAKLMVVPPIHTVDSNYGSESEDSDSGETRVTVS
ncbi:hypothetical protein, conserved [Angomonas deanei]|uniref:Leucine rich repeat n=1 Tax=Angomonas deanei TaxID=59799 RepID=A0A7G2C5F8_9TRYP|nr:hypothetical protein, conserved [Angomonas deanei]